MARRRPAAFASAVRKRTVGTVVVVIIGAGGIIAAAVAASVARCCAGRSVCVPPSCAWHPAFDDPVSRVPSTCSHRRFAVAHSPSTVELRRRLVAVVSATAVATASKTPATTASDAASGTVVAKTATAAANTFATEARHMVATERTLPVAVASIARTALELAEAASLAFAVAEVSLVSQLDVPTLVRC